LRDPGGFLPNTKKIRNFFLIFGRQAAQGTWDLFQKRNAARPGSAELDMEECGWPIVHEATPRSTFNRVRSPEQNLAAEDPVLYIDEATGV
jgi:hypothetical protein